MTIDQFPPTETGYGPTQASPKMFDFSAIFKIFARKAKLMIVITALALGVGWVMSQMKVDRFTASTSVLLEAPSLNPFGREQVFQATKFDNVTIESQMQVLRSTLLLTQVVEDLGLDKSDAFWTPERSAFATRVLAEKDRIFTQMGWGAAEEMNDAERFQAAVKKLRNDVSVSRNGVTSVLNVKVTANNRNLSADIANAISLAYITRRYDLRANSAADAAGWFETRMQELMTQLGDAEAQLSAAGTAQDSTSSGTDATAMAALRAAISDRLAAQTAFDQISVAARSNAALELLPAHLIGDDLSQLVAAYAATNDVAERLTLSNQARPLIEDALLKAQVDLATAQQAETAARAAIQGGGVAASAGAAGDLRALESEARIYRDMFETYTTTYLRTKEQQTFPTVDASILAPAVPPEAATGIGGKKLMAIALLVGMTLGGGMAVLSDSRDPRLRTRAALAQSVGAPVIGILPPAAKSERDIAAAPKRLASRDVEVIKNNVYRDQDANNIITLPEHHLAVENLKSTMSMTLLAPLSDYSETVRRIRVAFDNYFAPKNAKRGAVIGFLSDGGTETRSTLAMNYAEMVAVGGQRTLMIDFDWLESFLSRTITPSAAFGLPDLMFSGENFRPEQVFWLDERTGMFFLPNRSMDKRDTIDPAVFDTARLLKLIDALRLSFDQIVIDFGSLSAMVDAAALSPVVDGYVCSAQWGLSDRKALAKTMANSGVPPEKIVGAIMGDVSEKDLSRYEAAV